MASSLPEGFARRDMPNPAQLGRAVVEIKKLQKHQADARVQGYYDRLQRACSWLAKAQTVGDAEAQFIFSWIALNALYAVRPEVLATQWWKNEERARPAMAKLQCDYESPRELEWFIWRICGLDIDGRALRSVIEDRWGDVEVILRTRYLMSAFWAWRWRTDDDIEKWQQSSKRTAMAAIGPRFDREKMYQALCEVIVWRLRTLRNQLFHGGATDSHSRRRADGESELEAGSRVLSHLVWAFLTLMANEAGRARYWPPVPYPRAGSQQHQRFDASWLRATSH